ncbi:MAG: hypothetical protein M3P95_02540, partial [Actinomycetota bacterium]|nr:hypothetical protein [Actinomycetota bacterium]
PDPSAGQRGDGPVPPLASYAGPVWPVEAVHLLRSRPGRPGPYEEVARFPLGGVKDAARGTMAR